MWVIPASRFVGLPDVGDGRYDLFLFDHAGKPFDTHINLHAGEVFNFVQQLGAFGVGAEGISRFRIRGIEPAAGLSPGDSSSPGHRCHVCRERSIYRDSTGAGGTVVDRMYLPRFIAGEDLEGMRQLRDLCGEGGCARCESRIDSSAGYQLLSGEGC